MTPTPALGEDGAVTGEDARAEHRTVHTGPGRPVNDQVFREADKDLLKAARLLRTRGCGGHGHKENHEKREINRVNHQVSHADCWQGNKRKGSKELADFAAIILTIQDVFCTILIFLSPMADGEL